MSLEEQLQERLREGVPGHAAQRSAAPELTYGRHRGPRALGMRPAAVLVLLCRVDDGWWLPMIVRPATMLQHAGQTCFPGGAQEKGESLEECALREAAEEIAVDRERVSLIGRLTDVHVFASNYVVTPVLASCNGWPDFIPNPAEVQEVLRVSLDHVRRPESRGQHVIERSGVSFGTPHMETEGQRVWGASCMMLVELITLVDELDCSAMD